VPSFAASNLIESFNSIQCSWQVEEKPSGRTIDIVVIGNSFILYKNEGIAFICQDHASGYAAEHRTVRERTNENKASNLKKRRREQYGNIVNLMFSGI